MGWVGRAAQWESSPPDKLSWVPASMDHTRSHFYLAAAMKGESVWASRQHRAKIWQERKGSKDIVSFDETVLEGSFTPTFQLWGTINSLFVSPVWVGFSVIFNQNSPSWLTQWSKAKVSDSWNCSSETLYARDQSGEDSPTLVLLSQSRSLSSTEVWMN